MEIKSIKSDGTTGTPISISVPKEDLDTINVPLLHEIVKMQQAGQRSGNASTKTRGEVSGGGRKPYRQKGTGRARQGSSRAPQWRGGAIIFGPRPRDYYYRQPGKKMLLAIREALLSHLKDDTLKVVDGIELPSRKTKELVSFLDKCSLTAATSRILIVAITLTEEVYFSGRNIPGLDFLLPHQLNPYDILLADSILITKDAYPMVASLLERNSNGVS
jgi:large subunit ribosomal protein L4